MIVILECLAAVCFSTCHIQIVPTSPQMTSVSYLECLLYTMLGLLPTQLINTYLASTVKHMREVMADRANGYIVLVIQALISIVLMLYVLRMARIELSKLTSDVRATSGTCSQSPSYIL